MKTKPVQPLVQLRQREESDTILLPGLHWRLHSSIQLTSEYLNRHLVEVFMLLDHHLDLLLLAVLLAALLQEALPVGHPVLGLLAVPVKD